MLADNRHARLSAASILGRNRAQPYRASTDAFEFLSRNGLTQPRGLDHSESISGRFSLGRGLMLGCTKRILQQHRHR